MRGVLHHGGAELEEMRDPTPFPPVSATHRVGHSWETVATPPLRSGAVEQNFFPGGRLVIRY